jgi:membrane associated rhomboid family serine protease
MAPDPFPEFLLFEFAFVPARYSQAAIAASGIADPSLIGQVVPFLSYMFLHGDYTHLAMNSLWLLAFGPIVARRLGAARFLLFFAFCGIASALTHLVVYFGAPDPVVGASGGVSGLMGAAIRIFYGRLYFGRDVPPGAKVPLAPVVSRPIVGFTVVWLIANFVAGAIGLGLTDSSTSIAWVAHLGGYFAGLIGVALFDRSPLSARPVGHSA